jgi:hypothetical protein
MSDLATQRLRTGLFLSYGRRDAADLANRLRADLERRGYEVRQDPPQIREGEDRVDQTVDVCRTKRVAISLSGSRLVWRSTDSKRPANVGGVCLVEPIFLARHSIVLSIVSVTPPGRLKRCPMVGAREILQELFRRGSHERCAEVRQELNFGDRLIHAFTR